MKRIRYSKYVPDPAGEMSLEDLLSALSDYLLQSGFENYLYDAFPTLSRRSTICGAPFSRPCSQGMCSARKCASSSSRCRWMEPWTS